MRKCGTCNACCVWPSVEAIMKPSRTPCRYLGRKGHGCRIYKDRPEACASYACTWLRGVGATSDKPSRVNVLIDRRNNVFGHVLVAKSLKPGATRTKRGMSAITRAANQEGMLCLVTDDDDENRFVGAAGPSHMVAAASKLLEVIQ